MRYYCSYFDQNYLARALALFESLDRHESDDYRLFAVCLDEMTRLLLRALDDPRIVPIARHDLERHDPALIEPRADRTVAEYYYTLTPTVLLRLLDFVPEGEPLIYLDADLYFFSDPGPMLKEMEGHSVLIHEHRYAPDLAYLEPHSGRFNVGLLGFRNDMQGREVLKWYRARCNEWCYARTEDGKMADQMYLNDWPTRFEGVKVLEHPGGGVAPWNHGALRFDWSGEGLHVEGQPLVFFHFHAVTPLSPSTYLLSKHAAYPLPYLVIRGAYLPYVISMEAWNDWIRSHIPNLSFGYWPGQPLYDGAALLVRGGLAARLGDLTRHPLGQGWVLVPGRQVPGLPTEGM